MTETCATCRWHKGTSCRLHAPIIGGEMGMTAWPTTADDDWCSEHKPRESEASGSTSEPAERTEPRPSGEAASQESPVSPPTADATAGPYRVDGIGFVYGPGTRQDGDDFALYETAVRVAALDNTAYAAGRASRDEEVRKLRKRVGRLRDLVFAEQDHRVASTWEEQDRTLTLISRLHLGLQPSDLEDPA